MPPMDEPVTEDRPAAGGIDVSRYRPSRLWKQMPIERRRAAARAFWNDDQSAEQHAEAILAIARQIRFRPKSVQALPAERRAGYLAGLAQVSDAIASRALVAYHLETQRPMMGAFLDSLGIGHDEGLIADETLAAPPAARLTAAGRDLAARYPADDVSLYLSTLLAQDPDVWGALAGLPELDLYRTT
jgi:hypothetical protein